MSNYRRNAQRNKQLNDARYAVKLINEGKSIAEVTEILNTSRSRLYEIFKLLGEDEQPRSPLLD